MKVKINVGLRPITIFHFLDICARRVGRSTVLQDKKARPQISFSCAKSLLLLICIGLLLEPKPAAKMFKKACKVTQCKSDNIFLCDVVFASHSTLGFHVSSMSYPFHDSARQRNNMPLRIICLHDSFQC